MTLQHACHNICINSLQLPGIVTSTMIAFQTNKMVVHVAHLATILAVYVARGRGVGRGHGLHPHGRIEERKILAHVVRALHTQRTGVSVSPHVHGEAAKVHDVAALKAAKGFCALKHGLVADGTVPLQALGDTVMFVFNRNAGVAAHAVAIVNAKSFPRSANIACEKLKKYYRADGQMEGCEK